MICSCFLVAIVFMPSLPLQERKREPQGRAGGEDTISCLTDEEIACLWHPCVVELESNPGRSADHQSSDWSSILGTSCGFLDLPWVSEGFAEWHCLCHSPASSTVVGGVLSHFLRCPAWSVMSHMQTGWHMVEYRLRRVPKTSSLGLAQWSKEDPQVGTRVGKQEAQLPGKDAASPDFRSASNETSFNICVVHHVDCALKFPLNGNVLY